LVASRRLAGTTGREIGGFSARTTGVLAFARVFVAGFAFA
jgi:hypothetical protein